MFKLILAFVGLLFSAVLLITGYMGYEAYTFLKVPPEAQSREILFTVEPGQTFYEIAERLQAEGVIRNVQYFRFLAHWQHKLEAIQAGDFKINANWTPQQVLDQLVSGKPILYKLAIPEGLPWWEVARIVEKAGYASFEDFGRAIRDKELLKRNNIPGDSAEGFLFPETYMLKRARGKDAKPIVEMLIKMFWKQAAKAWPGGAPSGRELRDLVTLASLIEKETSVPEERPRVSGVYVERLKRNMLLQCDPTVIYGLGETFNGNITRKDLENAANLYNTYTHPGLPPGPICSPGLKSLQAAVNPERHEYIYFVAKGDGSHFFSKNLQEHNAAVRKYQLHKN
jgi:UPF0755 protein